MSWYEESTLGDECCGDMRCPDCRPDGWCDSCDTIDGRWCDAVFCYASTCDWCGELTSHPHEATNPRTQLGYCWRCVDDALKAGHLLPEDLKDPDYIDLEKGEDL